VEPNAPNPSDSETNPYQTPTDSGGMVTDRTQRPNAMDWFLAIVFGVLAAIVVFPTSCVGSVFLFVSAVGIHNSSSSAQSFVFLLMGICAALAIGSAVWVSRGYLAAARKRS